MSTDALSALPGSSPDAGTGPAVVELFEGLLDDAALTGEAPGADTALAAHRAHRRAWYADLVGPLVVPAATAEEAAAALTAQDHGLRILLAAPVDGPAEAARQTLRAARDLLAEDDRVEVVGVRVGVPAGPAGQATQRLLDSLDFTAPAWVVVTPGPGAAEALRVLADDGAENLAVPADGASTDDLAALLRLAVDLDLAFRITGRLPLVSGAGPGRLNLLCAVRAAVDGAATPDVATVLRASGTPPLASALRHMSEGDAAATRAVLAGIDVTDVPSAVAELVELGLVEDLDPGQQLSGS